MYGWTIENIIVFSIITIVIVVRSIIFCVHRAVDKIKQQKKTIEQLEKEVSNLKTVRRDNEC
jgi:hypothetical protein